MNLITDEMIMIEIKNGKKEYFNIILDRYYKMILNYAYRVLGKIEDAEEASQEIFLRLYFSVKNYKPVSSFKTFLFCIAHRECIRFSKKRKKFIPILNPNLYKQFDTPSSIYEERRDEELVKKAIMQLKPKYRSALILRTYFGLGYEEIAKIINCSLSDTKNYIFRSKEKLISILNSGGAL